MAETLTQEEVLPNLVFDVLTEVRTVGVTMAEHERHKARMEAELEQRAEIGQRHYGRPLTSFNGRDPLRDALEEVLDLAMYLKQWEMECAETPDPRPAMLRDRAVGLAFEILRLQRDA